MRVLAIPGWAWLTGAVVVFLLYVMLPRVRG